ncbi:MAG: YgiQ family radical SAM protein, partial [Thermoguttaceae bacterium]|nr:YgiQ family radical SAM protein [Thermoguttaceae bacterium]
MTFNDNPFLPTTAQEMRQRGWDCVDLVFVTGDAYVDHPSFAAAILGRWLSKHGYRVAILDQPDWHSCQPWREFGRPRLAFGISAGAMDSMVNKYTPFRRLRSADAYSPNGELGRRPDRAVNVYSQRAREAYPGCTVLIGGIEASLRRLAHYDHYSDKLRRSVLLDSKADLLMYGMGELTFLEVMLRLEEHLNDESGDLSWLHDIPGTAYRGGMKTPIPTGDDVIELPTWDEVQQSKEKFAEMTRIIYKELNPFCARTLVQRFGTEHVVVRPPQRPLTESEMDEVYSMPFTRQAHPKYGSAEIPALT